MSFKYLSSVQELDALNNISNRVFVRLSHEYGVCIIKRQLIPTLGSIVLKTIISNLNSFRKDEDDMSSYVNIDDILILGLVELNFDETEKAVNILPDFRLGKRGCEILGIDYDKYNKNQSPLNKFKGRIITKEDKNTWEDILYLSTQALYSITNIILHHNKIIDSFISIFIEEVFYEISKHIKDNDYSFKLYDLLYFENVNGMICLDSLPEYKLMVKNDSRLEDSMMVDNTEENITHHTSSLYY